MMRFCRKSVATMSPAFVEWRRLVSRLRLLASVCGLGKSLAVKWKDPSFVSWILPLDVLTSMVAGDTGLEAASAVQQAAPTQREPTIPSGMEHPRAGTRQSWQS